MQKRSKFLIWSTVIIVVAAIIVFVVGFLLRFLAA